MGDRLKATGLYFDEDTHRVLKVVAALEDRSVSELVRGAVLSYLVGEVSDKRLSRRILTEQAAVVSKGAEALDAIRRGGIGAHLHRRPEGIVTPEIMRSSDDILFVGRTLGALIGRCLPVIKSRIEEGARFRFLLLHPDDPSISTLSNSFESSAGPRAAVLKSLAMLRALELWLKEHSFPSTSVEVRLHQAYLGCGGTVAQLGGETHTLVIEVFSVGDRPQFILEPSDSPWFSEFETSFVQLWAEAEQDSWRTFIDPSKLNHVVEAAEEQHTPS